MRGEALASLSRFAAEMAFITNGRSLLDAVKLKSCLLYTSVIAAARSEGISSAIFAVASVVAIITMHDAMGVRHETGEQAKVLNQMIEEWIDISEKNAPFLQNMHLKEMVGHTPLQVMAGMVVGVVVGFLYPMHL